MTTGLLALALLLPLQTTDDVLARPADDARASTDEAAPEDDAESAPSDDEPAVEPQPTDEAAPAAARGEVTADPLPASAPASQATLTVAEAEPLPACQPASRPAPPTWTGGEEQPGLDGAKWWGVGIGLAASTKNLGPSFKLRYLWVMETQVGTDYLLTSALNGLSLDDLDAFRITFNTTAGFRLRPWPFSLDWRHAAAAPGPWPDLIFGLGGWSVLELDHVLQFFRQGDGGVWAGASIGGFLTLAFRDVTVSLLFRPLGITSYYLHGELDSTPFALGNPILDVNLSWTLPL